MSITADCLVMETRAQQHTPVMLSEVMALLDCRAGGFYVDATVGGGGYAEAFLRQSAPSGVVLGLDRDAQALDFTRHRLEHFGSRLILRRTNFAALPETLRECSLPLADGIVADLGVSSLQLDDPDRGFSFQLDGPLDMRMDRSLVGTAADLVNTLSEKELANVIFELGEERWARRIARAIVARRQLQPFARSLDLAGVITQVVPKSEDTRRIHPATRTFQALRLAVNQELESLEQFLSGVLDLLKRGGRLCIVAFHSLEDREVKRHFKSWANPCSCPRDLPVCRCGGVPLARLLTRKALRPRPEEIQANPRARSARLRAVEKI